VQTNKERKESMKNIESKLIEIFCHIDDFNRVFINQLQTHQLTDGTRIRIKPCSLNESEVMTIVIYLSFASDFRPLALDQDYQDL
jgi:hypothetical protein